MVELRIATLTGPDTVLQEAAIEEFRASLGGELIFPGDPAYDQARTIWNAMIDKHPALIVRCSGVSDVINSVNFARNNNLLVAVRGGGHSFPGNSICDGGLVIDLSLMKGVRVDPDQRTVRAEGALSGASLTGKPRLSAWPPPGAPTRTPASPDLPWGAVLAGFAATMALP